MEPDFQIQLFQDRTEYQSLVLFIPSREVTLHLGLEGIHTLGWNSVSEHVFMSLWKVPWKQAECASTFRLC